MTADEHTTTTDRDRTRWLRRAALPLAATAMLATAAPAMAQKKYDSGASDTEIKIGQTVPFSGPASAYATIGKTQAAYIKMINDQGGVNGRKIVLKVEDSGYDPKRAVLAAQKLVNQDQIFAMVGHLGTAANIAAFPVLFEKNVISFLPIAGAREMYEPLNPLKFAMLSAYYDQMRIAVPRMVKEKNAKKVCAIYQDDEFGLEVVRGAKTGKDVMATVMTVAKKIKSMPTDTNRVRRTDPGDPERCPVWQLHQVYSDDACKAWVQQGCKTAGIGCIECKQPVIDAIVKDRETAEALKPWYAFMCKRPCLDDRFLLRLILNAGFAFRRFLEVVEPGAPTGEEGNADDLDEGQQGEARGERHDGDGDRQGDGDHPVGELADELGQIGSRSDYLVSYLTTEGVMIRAGCFFGALDAFRAACVTTHGDSSHGREYAAAIAMIEAHAAIWTPV